MIMHLFINVRRTQQSSYPLTCQLPSARLLVFFCCFFFLAVAPKQKKQKESQTNQRRQLPGLKKETRKNCSEPDPHAEGAAPLTGASRPQCGAS